MDNSIIALHSIIDVDNPPFNYSEYSRFKFGDNLISKTYAKDLFDYFITKSNNFNLLREFKKIYIYSSPYNYIPTSSFYLTQNFFNLLDNYLIDKGIRVELVFGKINRLQTYTQDYGALSAEERYNLIKNDTYSFVDVPPENSLSIFIDDISITGTHQRVIENLILENNISCHYCFLYYAKLENNKIPSSFENKLNYAYVNTTRIYIDILLSINFVITTRATKYLLNLKEQDLIFVLTKLLNENRKELMVEILSCALQNKYDEIEEYENSIKSLYEFIEVECETDKY